MYFSARSSSTVFLLFLSMILLVTSSVNAEALPSIKQRVDAFNKQMMNDKSHSNITEQDMAVMAKAAQDIAASMPDPGLKVGTKAPDFTLGNAFGKPVRLSDKLQSGPVVLIFYRGAWCPYCNIQLHALRESVPEFRKHKASLIAITPQTPDKSLEQVKKDKFPFEILSDLNDKVARSYNLYFDVPPELHALYKEKFKLDIEAYNGKGRVGLPIPGSYVINQDGVIVAAFAEHDYKVRMEPADIVKALASIKK